MEINKEPNAKHTIASYDTESITIQSKRYTSSILISKNHLETTWNIKQISDLNEEQIQKILCLEPEIIIIGHNVSNEQIPINTRILLTKKGIGIESMSIGAACRTFNILLNENRNVVYGCILNTHDFCISPVDFKHLNEKT